MGKKLFLLLLLLPALVSSTAYAHNNSNTWAQFFAAKKKQKTKKPKKNKPKPEASVSPKPEASVAPKPEAIAAAEEETKKAEDASEAMKESFVAIKEQNYKSAARYSTMKSNLSRAGMKSLTFDFEGRGQAASALRGGKKEELAAEEKSEAQVAGEPSADAAEAKGAIAKAERARVVKATEHLEAINPSWQNVGSLRTPASFADLPPAADVLSKNPDAAAAEALILTPRKLKPLSASLRKYLQQYLSGGARPADVALLGEEELVKQSLGLAGGEENLVAALVEIAQNERPFTMLASDVATEVHAFIADFERFRDEDDTSLFLRIKRAHRKQQERYGFSSVASAKLRK